ncbi:hypothetical protein M569_09206 [Genlisea aurea]|uniref:Uncharacterized protein n=1 Tax=Genlisea aurea TaxID=192259 RepID=S8CFB5_9LAMI|nr:hypothetical protein M569_09206 [Genlisea aurea]
MADKGKRRDRGTRKDKGVGEFGNKKRKRVKSGFTSKRQEKTRPSRGPRLPNVLRKEIDVGDQQRFGSSQDTDSDDALGNDLFEYEEEAVAEEESRKNRRFDPVENYEFELPEKFEDWKVDSDESDDDGIDKEEDDARHKRMLEAITGLPTDTFRGRKTKDFIVSEAYPESEYNPSSDILDGAGKIDINDLLDPLHGKKGFSELRKRLNQMEKKAVTTLKPLPKADQERLERKAAYQHTKNDISKWEPLVKRNREAPTLYFDEDSNIGYSFIGDIAAEFEPRTEFEKSIASLIGQREVDEAIVEDGTRNLELNKVDIEEVKARKDRLAKMRSLLFRHEVKAKRIKKIKSKTYHRLLKKDRRKATAAAIEMDSGAAKELAMKQEFKRAEERMTLKHKNSSKWAKRILQRGLDKQDEATREAFGDQLNQHAALTRKMNSMKESSSDESSDDDSGTMSDISGQDVQSRLLNKAREKTLKLLEPDEELPKSGVLSLPFMERALKKKQDAAEQEVQLTLAELESSLNNNSEDNTLPSVATGRRVFGATKRVVEEISDHPKSDNFYDTDTDDDGAPEEDLREGYRNEKSSGNVDIDPNILREAFDIVGTHTVPESRDEVKQTYEVSYLASDDSWKKTGRASDDILPLNKIEDDTVNGITIEENGDGSGTDDDDDEMVDGILTSGPKSSYTLPSQAELIQRAFAGDDVEEEFKKDKEAVLNCEIPEPEQPSLIPGWGQWTDIQRKRGVPPWMTKEHDAAKKKRLESLKKRKDAQLKNVIISEKLDKKAEKLQTKALPYPFTSGEVFEQSIRMPIGPEFNPVSAVGPLNRPEVVKSSGVIIKPISYEDVSVAQKSHAEPRERNDGKRSNKGKKQRR